MGPPEKMDIDPYYQRQKCRPMILVSRNIRYMRIFAWVPRALGVGSNDSGGYFFSHFRQEQDIQPLVDFLMIPNAWS